MTKFPITRITVPVTIVVATSATVATAIFAGNGLLRGIMIDAPDLDSTNTYTVAVSAAGSYSIFSKASLVKNTKSSIFVDANSNPIILPIEGTNTITITASGTQSVDRAFTVVVLVDRG